MVDNDTVAVQLDYFYGMQSEMFSFLRIPKILIKDGRFEKMSNESKMLFGLLLDRMSLSMKNRWFDEEDRVYIIYTTDEIMIDLCIGTQKCVKLLKELEVYGLIERKKQGFSLPDIIYVKNFATLVNDGLEQPKEAEAKVKSRREKKKASDVDSRDEDDKVHKNVDNSTVFRKSKHESFENQNTGVLKIETREFPKSKHESFENQNTRVSEIETREFPKSKPNNTNIINTEYSNTDISNTDVSDTESHPITSKSDNDVEVDEMRSDVNHKQGVYFPLDPTEDILPRDEYRMEKLLEAENGIPYRFVNEPEKMKLAMQVLFHWSDHMEKDDDNCIVQDNCFYKLMLRNIIYMATSLEPIKINSGKQLVTYSKFIESMNAIYHKYGCAVMGFDILMDRCVERYTKATIEQEIVNPDAYAKSVIWSILQNFDADYQAWFNNSYYSRDWTASNDK